MCQPPLPASAPDPKSQRLPSSVLWKERGHCLFGFVPQVREEETSKGLPGGRVYPEVRVTMKSAVLTAHGDMAISMSKSNDC